MTGARKKGELCACEFFEKVEALLEKMKDYASPDHSFSQFLEEVPRESGDENIRARALEYVSGFDAADNPRPGSVSARWSQTWNARRRSTVIVFCDCATGIRR